MNDFNKNIADNTTDSKNDNEVGEDFVNNNQQDDSEKNIVVEEIETPVVKELAEVEVVEDEPELLFMSDIFEEEETLLADNSSTDLDLSITADLDLLEQAKKAYSEKDYTNALSFVNKFLETSNSSIDEALYLKGQILEKPFEQRNIRDALECYKLVISAYPQSDLWDKCDERIKYIQRFYFNIR
jgi:tetratricopeptide (TPR) repeat protein